MSQLTVLSPGRLTTLQDLGRRGVMAQGLSTGGVADAHAAGWANHLLSNSSSAPLLENTLGGLQVRFCAATSFVLTGADCQATLSGQPESVKTWQVVQARAGDELTLSYPLSGLRTYLAVGGGFRVASWLGDSCTTVMRERMGGLRNTGEALQTGDELPYQPVQLSSHAMSSRFLPDYREMLTLRVILGAQVSLFRNEALESLFTGDYQISPNSDRMGVRLQGAAVEALQPGLVSEGISLGAIQIPADGQPIILMQDRQTIGGYPKVGSVLPLDLYALAQRPPGAIVRFTPIALFEAQQAMRKFTAFFR